MPQRLSAVRRMPAVTAAQPSVLLRKQAVPLLLHLVPELLRREPNSTALGQGAQSSGVYSSAVGTKRMLQVSVRLLSVLVQ